MLTDIGHESSIEHVSFTFGVEGVEGISIACFHRLFVIENMVILNNHRDM